MSLSKAAVSNGAAGICGGEPDKFGSVVKEVLFRGGPAAAEVVGDLEALAPRAWLDKGCEWNDH
ncbi:hypothetical protein ACFLQ0_01400 [Nitrospinota bacterium]